MDFTTYDETWSDTLDDVVQFNQRRVWTRWEKLQSSKFVGKKHMLVGNNFIEVLYFPREWAELLLPLLSPVSHFYSLSSFSLFCCFDLTRNFLSLIFITLLLDILILCNPFPLLYDFYTLFFILLSFPSPV